MSGIARREGLMSARRRHKHYSDSIHTNCRCTLEQELKDDEEFMRQLEEYVRDEGTEGAREIELWAMRYGLTV